MRSATKAVVSTFGALAGLTGIEHGHRAFFLRSAGQSADRHDADVRHAPLPVSSPLGNRVRM